LTQEKKFIVKYPFFFPRSFCSPLGSVARGGHITRPILATLLVAESNVSFFKHFLLQWWREKEEAGPNCRGPAVRKGVRGPTMLLCFYLSR